VLAGKIKLRGIRNGGAVRRFVKTRESELGEARGNLYSKEDGFLPHDATKQPSAHSGKFYLSGILDTTAYGSAESWTEK
jgi:hypothetical protein